MIPLGGIGAQNDLQMKFRLKIYDILLSPTAQEFAKVERRRKCHGMEAAGAYGST